MLKVACAYILGLFLAFQGHSALADSRIAITAGEPLAQITALVAAHPEQTSEKFTQVESLMFRFFGNPEMMANDRQRDLFYQDISNLISQADAQSDFLTAQSIVLVGLNLLMKTQDPNGRAAFYRLRMNWNDRLREGTGRGLMRVQSWADLSQAIEHRTSPASRYPARELRPPCTGFLIDKRV